MGAEPITLTEEILLRLTLIRDLMLLQADLDSSAPVHVEIEKRIKAQLDAVDANLETQIKSTY